MEKSTKDQKADGPRKNDGNPPKPKEKDSLESITQA